MYDYPEDVARIVAACRENGATITPDDAECFWLRYSDSMDAGWLCLPSDNKEIAFLIFREMVKALQ